MGQRVYVLDPFGVADVPADLKASCNLLAGITADSPTAREDLRVIADGIVMRYKAEDATWDNGAVSVVSGVMAYVCATHPPEERDLTAVRRLLTLPPDALQEMFKATAETGGFGNLCKAAASIGLSDSRKNREFVGGAIDHTEWLDSPSMVEIMTGQNGLDLSILKEGDATVYLVLPPHYLSEHARFLRLFVRAALDAMAKRLTGKKCLFMLDEFFALGHIEQISKAAGLMPGYGVHLWPFMQDLGQLRKLYGEEGATGFFANADANIFFGNGDAFTLEFISRVLGRKTTDDIGVKPPQISETDAAANLRALASMHVAAPRPMPHIPTKNHQGAAFAASLFVDSLNNSLYQTQLNMQASAATAAQAHDREQHAKDQNAMREYQHAMSARGEPRLFPDEIKHLVGKARGEVVARSMIVFLGHGEVLNIHLAPYFEPKLQEIVPREEIEFLKSIQHHRAVMVEACKTLRLWAIGYANQKPVKWTAISALWVIPIVTVLTGLFIAFKTNIYRDEQVLMLMIAANAIALALMYAYLDKKKTKALEAGKLRVRNFRAAYWYLLTQDEDIPPATVEKLSDFGRREAGAVRDAFIEHAQKSGLRITLKPTDDETFIKAGLLPPAYQLGS
ncbi:hypothetical protein MBRA_06446 [Methylobacterium brachiatum]|nr:hypothetical protein MBRA_06446 [Methylobacterium brachiatum]